MAASNLVNLVGMQVTGTPGTGTITLGSVIPGKLTPAQGGVSNGQQVTCEAVDGTTTDLFTATYNSGPGTLTGRTCINSTNGNANASLSSSALIYFSAASQDIVNKGGDTMTGLLVLSGDPAAALGAATKQYVDAVIAGLDFKNSCDCATTANLTATYANGTAGVGATLTNSGAQAAFSVDGRSPAINSRVLVKNQSTAFQNGIYVLTTVGSGVANWVLTRATDFDSNTEILPGDIVPVEFGTLGAGSLWLQTATVATIGSDTITFSSFSQPSLYAKVASNLSDLAAVYTAFDNLSVHGADIASATTTNLETSTGNLVDVTGTTAITGITLNEGHARTVRFTGILTLTNGASLVLPGGANITTAAGDYAIFVGYAAGVVRCVDYTRKDGTALVSTAGAGGALVTSTPTAFALTKASLRSQNVAFTTASQSVTLPDATTYATGDLGGPIFSIKNSGATDFAIRRNDATILCVLAMGGSADIWLDDRSTAAGNWHYETSEFVDCVGGLKLVDSSFGATFTAWGGATTADGFKALPLTSTLSLHFIRSSTNIYVVACDHTTPPGTVGTPVSIDSVATNVGAAMISATTALIWWMNSTTFKSAIVSVSGTTITLGTPATAVTTPVVDGGGNQTRPWQQPCYAIMGTSYALIAYRNGSNVLAVMPISFSGTTVFLGTPTTFGSAANASNQINGVYTLTSTTALIVYTDDSGTTTAPFSIRGVVVTLSGTPGSGASAAIGTTAGTNDVVQDDVVTTGLSQIQLPIAQHSTTLYTIVYRNPSNILRAQSISVSGTTVTFGTAVNVDAVTLPTTLYFCTNGCQGGNQQNYLSPTLIALSSTLAHLAWQETNSVPSRNVVITNTAGTITIGTISVGLGTTPVSSVLLNGGASSAWLSTGASVGGLDAILQSGSAISWVMELSGPLFPASLPAQDYAAYQFANGTIVCEIQQTNRFNVFKMAAGQLIYMGSFSLPYEGGSGCKLMPLSATKLALMYTPNLRFTNGIVNAPRLTIMEFPS